MNQSQLAEPGILLRMVSPATEDAHPNDLGGPPFAIAHAVPGRSLLSFSLLALAVVWWLLDAAATLGHVGAIGGERLLPGALAAAAGLAVGFLLPWRARRLGAAMDIGAVALLLGAALAGLWQRDELRLYLQAGVVAWLLATVSVAPRSLRGLPSLRLGLAVLAGATAAVVRPWLLAACGAPAVQAVSVVWLLLAVLRPRPHPVVAGPTRAALVALPFVWALLWWIAPCSLATDAATGSRSLFAMAVGASLALFAGGAVLPTLVVVIAVGVPAVWLETRSAAADAAITTVLVRTPHAVASYDRATQTLQLAVEGEVVARTGPDHRGAELGSTLVQMFARAGDRVLVLGTGTGRLPEYLLASGHHEVEVVDPRADRDSLRTALRGDGPVPPSLAAPPNPRVRLVHRDLPSALASLPSGSRQGLVVVESPHTAAPWQVTVEWQRELRRVAGDGLVLQSFAFDLVSVARLRALLGAAVVAHAWNAVVAVGDDAWLLCAASPPRWPDDDLVADWGEEARWIAHAAHVGGVADVRRALHGIVTPAASRDAVGAAHGPVVDGARGRREVLGVLHELLHSEPIEDVADPGSLLLRWLGSKLSVQLAVDEIEALGDTVEDQHRAQAIACRFLPVGAPAACLQACLGLPAFDGAPLVDPALAIRRAHAMQPRFGDALPPVLRSMRRRAVAERGDLEDLASLPPSPRLAVVCVGTGPLATALRVRFASACARALLELLAVRSLSAAETEALRELADPFVLDVAGRALTARGAVTELLSLWRRDLPMPAAFLASWPTMGDDARLAVLRALGGRSDGGSLQVLAEGMRADGLALRRAAASALRASVGDRIDYDPEWSRSALNEAAERVRSLHNRAP